MHVSRIMAADDDVDRALSRLRSLHDGDTGVVDIVACGARAVPALRETLFAREPSGLYEARRRAVDALAQLHADYVLVDYLRAPHDVADPVEQTGEDAVVNAAARALGQSADQRAVALLLALTRGRPLAGVIDALSQLGRTEALPYFLGALAEDSTRIAAEAAIWRLGPRARPALLAIAARRAVQPADESVSSRRQRRSALRVFAQFGAPPAETGPTIVALMDDDDPWIAALASDLCLAHAPAPVKSAAADRLVDLLGGADWLLGVQIEESLRTHLDDARPAIERFLAEGAVDAAVDSPQGRAARVLRRLAADRAAGPKA